jgi:hypothetical protein
VNDSFGFQSWLNNINELPVSLADLLIFEQRSGLLAHLATEMTDCQMEEFRRYALQLL